MLHKILVLKGTLPSSYSSVSSLNQLDDTAKIKRAIHLKVASVQNLATV